MAVYPMQPYKHLGFLKMLHIHKDFNSLVSIPATFEIFLDACFGAYRIVLIGIDNMNSQRSTILNRPIACTASVHGSMIVYSAKYGSVTNTISGRSSNSISTAV